MSTRVRVLRGVTIRRVVTTQRRATRLTGPQMHPSRADLHAFFAFSPLRMFDTRNRLYVSASFFNHDFFPLLTKHLMYEGNRNRSFADGRRHAFDITSPNIA